MEQDKGDTRKDQPRPASLGQRWAAAQPTKTMTFWACVASMVLTMIVGFAWGGWVTGGTSQKQADTQTEEALIKRLAPICVVQYNQDPGKVAKLAALKGTDSWQRDGYIEKQGWAVMPGEAKTDSKVAEACAQLLLASK